MLLELGAVPAKVTERTKRAESRRWHDEAGRLQAVVNPPRRLRSVKSSFDLGLISSFRTTRPTVAQGGLARASQKAQLVPPVRWMRGVRSIIIA